MKPVVVDMSLLSWQRRNPCFSSSSNNNAIICGKHRRLYTDTYAVYSRSTDSTVQSTHCCRCGNTCSSNAVGCSSPCRPAFLQRPEASVPDGIITVSRNFYRRRSLVVSRSLISTTKFGRLPHSNSQSGINTWMLNDVIQLQLQKLAQPASWLLTRYPFKLHHIYRETFPFRLTASTSYAINSSTDR